MPSGKRLSWYLAAEEYFAKNITEEIIFFWKVAPTVIFGRHQVMENEVNLAYCRDHHVDLVRRKSGGGCVYADEGNLMTSYLSPSTHSVQVFHHYLDMMASALRQLGIPAVTTEHNDILVNTNPPSTIHHPPSTIHHPQSTIHTTADTSYKVSGNACYTLPTGTIVHGTMLYDVDFEALEQAITPDHDKLAKHGVSSVRQRVINLKSVINPSFHHSAQRFNSSLNNISALQSALSSLLCDQHITLPIEAIAAINAIEQTYERFL